MRRPRNYPRKKVYYQKTKLAKFCFKCTCTEVVPTKVKGDWPVEDEAWFLALEIDYPSE